MKSNPTLQLTHAIAASTKLCVRLPTHATCAMLFAFVIAG